MMARVGVLAVLYLSLAYVVTAWLVNTQGI